MPSNAHWGLLTVEIVQATINLACLAINAHTLRVSLHDHRLIVASGQNHGADAYAWASVRSKGANVAVQLLILSMGLDRIDLIAHGYTPDLLGHFIIFGICRTLIGVLVALTAYVNMLSFRRLRNLWH